MKVFVTGATGFIGYHLVKRLLMEGHEVRCLVRETSNVQPLLALDAQIVVGDVSNREAMLKGMAGCDWLFHLANLYSMWERNPNLYMQVNIAGTELVLDCALQTRVGRVVYLSTVAVFGKPKDVPFNEQSRRGPVLFSEYARTKAAAEKNAWEKFDICGLPLVVLYPAIVLGSGDDKASGQYIQNILSRRVPSTIFHDSISTYTAVDDVVEAMLLAAKAPHAVGQKYLIGKTMLSGKEFAGMIHEISGVPLPIFRFPDWMVLGAAAVLTTLSAFIHLAPLWGLSVDAGRTLKNGFCCDGSKAERDLGLVYTPIQDALQDAISSYKRETNRSKEIKGRLS